MKKMLSLLIVCLTMSVYAQKEVLVDSINYIIDQSDYTAIVSKNPNAVGDIIIPSTIRYEGNQYDIVEIGENAFRGNLIEGSRFKREHCKITSIQLPEGIKTIGERAFCGCDGLFAITIPNSVKKIEDGAFDGSGLTKVVFGSGLTKIGDWAFSGTKLKKVVIPNNVTQLGENVFRECRKLVEVKIGDGVKTLPHGTFMECEGLETVIFGENLQRICEGAFMVCGTLADINLPNSLKEIESFAFKQCPMLVTLSIPEGVSKLRDGIVSDCENFEMLITKSPHPEFTVIGGQQWVVTNCPNFKGIYSNYGGDTYRLFP